MSRWRILPRLSALVLLAVVLIGLPCVLVATIGAPFPSPARLAEAWHRRRVPGDLVIRAGAFVFALLWAWFAATALAELAQIVRHRRDGAPLRAVLPSGPSGWVRGLVRVVAIGSVSATAAIGGLLPMIRSSADVARPAHVATAVVSVAEETPPTSTTAVLAGGSTTVSNGRDTPYSLALAGGRADLRDQIIDLNNGRPTPDGGTWTGGVFPAGMVVLLPDATSLAPAPAMAASSSSTSALASFASGVGTALLLSAGAVSLLEARRRRQWRTAGVGSRLPQPSPEAVRVEALLRALDAPERIARLDVAVRSAARDVAAQGASIVAAVLGDHGEVCLHLHGAAVPEAGPWVLDLHTDTWRIGAEVELAELAEAARNCDQPCPAMAHIGGVPGGGELFVDLEAVGTLQIDSPCAEAILRGLATSLSVSPFLDVARLFTVGLGEQWPGSHQCEVMDTVDAAVEGAVMALGSTPTMARGTSTFALRTRGRGGEAWEPAIVVSHGSHPADGARAEVRSIGGGHGLAVVGDVAFDDAGWVLSHTGDHHVLSPLGLTVHPVGLTVEEVSAVEEVLASGEAPLETHAPVLPIDVLSRGEAPSEPYVEAEWSLMVRVLGPVEVVSCAGEVAAFERSKSLELVVWLGQHRERPTRTAARTALWDLDVRDATFANVVSDARRALARVVAPPEGEEWVARTLTEELPLHEGVVTDADLLAARVAAARGRRATDAIELLRPGVELLGGLPFAGTNYLWTDAEGITSAHVLLATGAAIELAEHYLALGDIDGVFWATGQGLRVLAGHEELIALRMRAHARRGDLAGVRSEWESYERALAADPWAAAEPATKLVGLRRELLAGDRERGLALA